MPPGSEWRENAAAISRVFFYAVKRDRARVWYGWLGDTAFKDMEASMRLGAIAQLADTGGKGGAAAYARAWAAARAGRRGEAILSMLTALGHDGVARAEPRARGAEARRLAVEAALANGS